LPDAAERAVRGRDVVEILVEALALADHCQQRLELDLQRLQCAF